MPIEEEPDPDLEPELDPELEPDPEPEPVLFAPFDNGQSAADPHRTCFLSITGERAFEHIDAISNVEGDLDDWVQFEFPNNSNPNQVMQMSLECTFIGPELLVRATIWEDGAPTLEAVSCNEGLQVLTVDNTKVQSVRIHFVGGDEPTLLDYRLSVVGFR